jgi:hypothetical protein
MTEPGVGAATLQDGAIAPQLRQPGIVQTTVPS